MGQSSEAEETRRLAYAVWAIEAQRSPRKVAEILYRDHGLAVSVRTIQDWVKRYEWPAQVSKDIAQMAGPLHQEQLAELFLLSIDARRFLRNLLQLGADRPKEVDATYGKSLGALVNAAMGSLDRAGYSHLGRIMARVHEIDNPVIAEAIAGVDDLTMEQLQERDRMLVEAEMKQVEAKTTKR